jgi:radical SAM-linked protein
MTGNDGTTPCKKALWFSICGDIRFLSHRDTMTLWQRALRRAGLPVRFSAGFNPHLRLSLPLPRSVGMASDCELLLFELTETVADSAAVAALETQLPDGIAILDCQAAADNIKWMPQWADYRVLLHEKVKHHEVRENIKLFVTQDHWAVERPPRGRHPKRSIDIRQAVSEFSMNPDGLFCRITIGPSATPRMNEVCQALRLDAEEDVREIRRLAVGYPSTVAPPTENQSYSNV